MSDVISDGLDFLTIAIWFRDLGASDWDVFPAVFAKVFCNMLHYD